jgi:rRNA-processing protein FCF1
VNALYLDGNNMLFLSAALRKHALGRGQRWKAEAMLTSLAESFAHAKSATGLQNTVMIYDSISKHRCCVKTLEGGTRFAVASARPEFATSDDALVAWAKAMPPAQAKASLFVTSDRELKDRLIAAGVLVTKPKQWVELARRTVESASQRNAEQLLPEEGEERAGDQIRSEVSLDDFLEEWGKKLVLADADSATEETVGQARPSSDGMLFQ